MEAIAFYLIMDENYQFKDSEIRLYPFCFGNISKDLIVDNMRKTGLNEYVNEFAVDYNTIDINEIVDIHKYLTKKHNIK